jgi:hypothetical protein
MQRLIKENARVKTFRYDLLRDLPSDIGDRIGGGIHFSENDVSAIIEAILDQMSLCKSPEENIVFDVYVKGILPYWLAGSLTYAFTMCDNVRSFKLLHPGGSSYLVFSRSV